MPGLGKLGEGKGFNMFQSYVANGSVMFVAIGSVMF